MSETPSLLSRLEALTGPSREIDAEIDCMIGRSRDRPPRYTESIDAAMTLLRDDYDIDLFRCNGVWTVMYGPAGSNDADIDVRGATAAIALCIAALKAKEETK